MLLGLLILASPIDALDKGASEAEVRGQGFSIVDAGAPQTMQRALIETGMLEEINRSKAAPLRSGAFDFSQFEKIGFKSKGKSRYVAVLAQGKLRYLFAIEYVPPKGAGWKKGRLSPLRNALSRLAPFRLRGKDPDRFGNTREWTGRRGTGKLAVRYVAERDTLRVLLY